MYLPRSNRVRLHEAYHSSKVDLLTLFMEFKSLGPTPKFHTKAHKEYKREKKIPDWLTYYENWEDKPSCLLLLLFQAFSGQVSPSPREILSQKGRIPSWSHVLMIWTVISVFYLLLQYIFKFYFNKSLFHRMIFHKI